MAGIVINGAAGQMGNILVRLSEEMGEIELVGAVDHPDNPGLGRDVGELAGIGSLGIPLEADFPDEADVVMDFSQPQGTMTALRWCLANEVALVVGTTGLDEEEQSKLDEASQAIALLQSPNMSLGINLLLKIVPVIAEALGDDFDVEIVETHHRFKKDAPSGTALKLAEVIARARGEPLSEVASYGRHGAIGVRPRGEIGIHAVRGGDIVGDHTIIFAGPGERIELTHRAHQRETFARGALRAAIFLAEQPPGKYSLADVLGL